MNLQVNRPVWVANLRSESLYRHHLLASQTQARLPGAPGRLRRGRRSELRTERPGADAMNVVQGLQRVGARSAGDLSDGGLRARDPLTPSHYLAVAARRPRSPGKHSTCADDGSPSACVGPDLSTLAPLSALERS